MSARISDAFHRLRSRNQSGFVAYITAGDPSPEHTLEILSALERAGADLIELGIPFSDPLADGPTIQAAAGRALKAGTTVAVVLDLIREFRRRSDLPLVLFTYLNPIYARGFGAFCREAAEAGADGVLVLDMPPEEQQACGELAASQELDLIRLVAPTTPPERMRAICREARGFIYYVSREGVTGEQESLSDSLGERMALLRQMTSLPVAVGFGVSTPAQAAAVGQLADAVVVGSAIVRRASEIGNNPSLAREIEHFVRPMAEAAHHARST